MEILHTAYILGIELPLENIKLEEIEKIINILWGLGIGDWGLGIGDWAQSPIPNPQSPIPIPNIYFIIKRNID